MDVTLIKPEDSAYPDEVEERLQDRPAIAALGNIELLQSQPLAFFCSIKCPGDVILRTYDLIRALRDAGVPMIGGFHSPMEKECLALLLRGTQPVIVCPAREIGCMRVPRAWRQPLADRRILILSPFAKRHRRVTARTSQTRNLFVTALADKILISHAAPGSRTERLCEQSLTSGKRVWTIASADNANLLGIGAASLRHEQVTAFGLGQRGTTDPPGIRPGGPG